MPTAVASVAIVVYLIGLVLTIAGNSTSGSSVLVRAVKGRLFSPWMQPAWLDLGFDHPLTFGFPEDAHHSLEVRSRSGKSVTMAYPGERSGEQAARWRRLARSIALAAADGDAASLVAGVAEGSFTELATEDAVVRILRPALTEPRSRSDDEPLTQPHASRVRRVAGEIQVIELGGPLKQQELAPVLRQPTAVVQQPDAPKPPGEEGTDD